VAGRARAAQRADSHDAEAAESRRSVLNELKSDAGAISLDSVISEIAKTRALDHSFAQRLGRLAILRLNNAQPRSL